MWRPVGVLMNIRYSSLCRRLLVRSLGSLGGGFPSFNGMRSGYPNISDREARITQPECSAPAVERERINLPREHIIKNNARDESGTFIRSLVLMAKNFL